MRRRWLLLLAFAFVGCDLFEAPKEPRNAAAMCIPTGVPASDAPCVFQAGPFAWPAGGTSTLLRERDHSVLVWKSEEGSGLITFPREAARAVVHDANGDGVSELVVFPTPSDITDIGRRTWIVGISPTRKPARMLHLEMQVLGAFNESMIDRERGELATFGLVRSAPLFGTARVVNPERLIARLPYATATEMQQLVGRGGVKLCEQWERKSECEPVSQESIDQNRATEIASHGGSFAEFDSDPKDDQGYDLQPPICAPEGTRHSRIRCLARVRGSRGGEWIFERLSDNGGEKLRLTEVWRWADDS